jgi:thiamine-monophosphate kinase
MKLSQLGEFGLIEGIRRKTPKGRGVRMGIGDDAAWVSNPTGSSLITADLLIEGVHFDFNWTSMFDLGYKTLAVNLSDIAAMGGIPAYLVLSLGIPVAFDSEKIAEFYRGIRALAAKSGVALIGGDTNVAQTFLVSACVIGHAPHRPVSRGGAKLGDDIYVTGTLGDAALALQFLRGNLPSGKKGLVGKLLARHHRPTPRLMAGRFLAKERLASAMIDISDGLLQDLGHVCRASRIGAVLTADSLPLSRAYRAFGGSNSLRCALTGGEDYELLFCARQRDRARIISSEVQQRAKVAITHIGTCVAANEEIAVLDACGKPLDLPIKGHDHFKIGSPARRKRLQSSYSSN